jgi:hypothetical protein
MRVEVVDGEIVVNGRRRPLSAAVTAEVEVSGSLLDAPAPRRPGLVSVALAPKLAAARVVSGALRPRQYDTRAVYLSLQGPDWFELVEYPSSGASSAREDAAAVNAAVAALAGAGM